MCKKIPIFTFSLALIIGLVAAPTLADWVPADGHKMHYPQLPDETGWDVDATMSPEQQLVLADDWLCTVSGPVEDIHFWGSWMYDSVGTILYFVVSIHSNIPSPPAPYSMPGDTLWVRSFSPAEFQVIGMTSPGQGWYDPTWGYRWDDHTQYFQYNITDIPEPFIQVQGEVYWLSIYAMVYATYPREFWGWKSSMSEQFMDGGVWAYWAPELAWQQLTNPQGYPLDLAFVITGGEVPIHDTVKCEPQGGNNPYHPPTYWYDVTPGAFGRCDFHVMVFDSIATNYSNWVEPVGWQHLLHKVGNDWWVSWWSPGCVNAIFSTFRFQFDNPNPAVWGGWTTTIDGTSNPFAQVIDSSGNHSTEPDGYGYHVHVPLLPAPGCDFMPGDANGDGNVMGNDVTYNVRYFKGLGANPSDSCWNDSTSSWLYSAGDANGNCQYAGSDVTFLVSYFKGYNPAILWCPQTPPTGGGAMSVPGKEREDVIDRKN